MVFENILSILPTGTLINLIAAVIILLVGILIANVASKLIHRLLKELEANRLLKEQAKMRLPLDELAGSLVKYGLYLAALILALNQLGLANTTLRIILWALLLIFIIFVILAFKDIMPNMVAGFVLQQKGIIKKGNFIRIKNIEGRVVHMDLLELRLMTKNKEVVHMPNSYVMKHEIIKLA